MTHLEAAITAMAHPWRWGTHDCCASACSAFEMIRGIDPLAPLRGLYHDGPSATALIEARGGWLALADQLAAAAGLQRCAGDGGALGLALGPMGYSLTFGVGPGLWAGKTLRGFALLHSIERAWV